MTARQLDVLQALHSFELGHGYQPTVRELAAALGLASSATVQMHLAGLERQGLIEGSGRRRRVTTLGLSALNRPKVAA